MAFLFARVLLASLVIVMLFCLSASAEEQACPKPEPVPLSLLLLPPPNSDSIETEAELFELFARQELRTGKDEQHAAGDHVQSITRFLGEMGIALKEDHLQAVDHLFDCIKEIAEHEVKKAKEEFKRTRPYKLPQNGLRPLKEVTADDSPSYPSGHATYGMAVGLVLAEMLPEKRDGIFKRIQDYGLSRMVSGVHFRGDVYAGQISGAAIATSLFENEEFRKQFSQAKGQLRKSAGYE